MDNKTAVITDKLICNHSLGVDEYELLLSNANEDDIQKIRAAAVDLRKKYYQNTVFIRGLIEISNFCKNDCYYCGIRKSNKLCDRYRLCEEEILSCCENGYELGFRTFVLQGGEDDYFNDDTLAEIIVKIKRNFPDCAITLSLGEKNKASYEALFLAGADRYLLRHETANPCHYKRLHPKALSFEHRINCLKTLKEIGYQTGCGFMVGSPFQTNGDLAMDLKFIEEFQPHMCGIGPFIPHECTPFRDYKSGSIEKTCFLLSIIRIICPNILLPATTALGTLDENGREKGILAGANVIMPNLSPKEVRSKYTLYNNKLVTGAESAEMLYELKNRISKIGYEIVCSRGDALNKKGE